MKFFIFLLTPLTLSSQTFEKSENTFLHERYSQYYDRAAGILVKKTFKDLGDSAVIKYEIGLVLFRKGRESDDFMRPSSFVVLEDKSVLVFTDEIYVNYFIEGKHQYSVRHLLTNDELTVLKTKKIDSFSIAEETTSLDKWQKDKALKAFLKIESQ